MKCKSIHALLIVIGALFSAGHAAGSSAAIDTIVPPPIDTTPPPVTNTGSVVGVITNDSTKAVIAGATVVLSHRFGKTGPGTADTTSKITVSGADGAFQFDSVTSGNYGVTASSPGMITGSVNIKVAAIQVAANLALKVEPPPTSNIIGTVIDSATGLPIFRVKVLLRVGPKKNALSLDTCMTDSMGHYEFLLIHSPPVGAPYTVEVSKHLYKDMHDTAVIVADNATDTVNFTMALSANVIGGGIVEHGSIPAGWNWIHLGENNALRISGGQGMEGDLEVYGSDGKLFFATHVGAMDREIKLPAGNNGSKRLIARFSNAGHAVWAASIPN